MVMPETMDLSLPIIIIVTIIITIIIIMIKIIIIIIIIIMKPIKPNYAWKNRNKWTKNTQ